MHCLKLITFVWNVGRTKNRNLNRIDCVATGSVIDCNSTGSVITCVSNGSVSGCVFTGWFCFYWFCKRLCVYCLDLLLLVL